MSRPIESVTLGIREAGAAEGPVRVHLNLQRRWVLHLPRVRCKALFLFDHSSGHERGDELSLNANIMPKGPDWNGKVPLMRDGWYVGANGRRVVHRMQFREGEMLPCDVSCPAGIDPQKPAGAATERPPSVQAEQLLGRQVVMELSDLSFTGRLTELREPEDRPARPRNCSSSGMTTSSRTTSTQSQRRSSSSSGRRQTRSSTRRGRQRLKRRPPPLPPSLRAAAERGRRKQIPQRRARS